MATGTHRLTELLHRADNSSAGADAMYEQLYLELRRLAAPLRMSSKVTLLTTALVNESYLLLRDRRFESRQHFFALASQAMRRVLVDRARNRHAARSRPAPEPDAESNVAVSHGPEIETLLSIDASLEQLARVDPRAAKIVELRAFGGLTDAEVAETLGLSLSTVRRNWSFARAFLASRLKRDAAER
ncbi:MAG: ECF-type sigma factor [Vicinamibacterales bacterium]